MENRTDTFLVAVKAAVPEPLDPALEGDLVRKLATTSRLAAARAAAQPTAPLAVRRAPERRFAMPARVALVTGLLIVSTAGLAVAGVKLPAAASTVFDKIGIELPNQSDEAGNPPTITLPQPSTGGSTAPATGGGKAKGKGKQGHKAKPGKPSNSGHGSKPGKGPKPGKPPKASKPPRPQKPKPQTSHKPEAPKPPNATKEPAKPPESPGTSGTSGTSDNSGSNASNGNGRSVLSDLLS